MSGIMRNFMNQYYKRPNRVKVFQEAFQHGHLPVYLRGPSDHAVYKGLMGLSLVGIGLSIATLYAMASGNLKKQ